MQNEINYPKIYSLSTVGVRQHYKQDYFFHQIRTDFTGGNGTGKSIIADLLQLIFVPKRDIWKPGTKGTDPSKRRIEGIPLNKDFVNFAYAFLNIERAKNKFITIGVYIPNTSRQPVRPFIIQENEKFDKSRLLHSSDFPIKANDFYHNAGAGAIRDLKEIRQFVFEEYNLFFTDFFGKEKIDLYFELLHKNQVFPINLAKQSSLKSYAKVVQSFSRADEFDITNSKSLKKFLFEDNEDIKKRFEQENEQLEKLLLDYRDADNSKLDLQNKQEKLNHLKETHELSKRTLYDFLKKDLIFTYSEYSVVKKAYEKNIADFEKKEELKITLDSELSAINKEIYKTQIEIKAINENLIKLHGKLKPYITATINNAKKEETPLTLKLEKINSVKKLWNKYHSIEKIEKQFNDQQANVSNLKRFNELQAIKHYSFFKKSEWINGTDKATEYYRQKITALEKEIENSTNLLEFYKGNNKNSLFHWTINRQKKLSRNEELAIMYFKYLVITKPSIYEKGTKYIIEPEQIFKNIEEDKNGIWINFGNIKEFIPNNYIDKQIFTDPKQLEKVLQNKKNEIEINKTKNKELLTNIIALQTELSSINFNNDLLKIFKNQKVINNFVADNEITESKIEILKEVENEIKNEQTIIQFEKELEFATKVYQAAIGKLTEIERDIKEISNENSNLIQTIENLQAQYIEPVLIKQYQKNADDYKEIESLINSLNTEQNLIKGALKEDKKKQDNVNKRINANDKTITRLETEKPHLEKENNTFRNKYESKKSKFQDNSRDDIEKVLKETSENINEELINELKKQSETAQDNYGKEFIRTEELFDETKNGKNIELIENRLNFETLVKVLCGKIGLEEISTEIDKLGEELIKIGNLQLKVIIDVFSKVETEYKRFDKIVKRLNFFFKEEKNEISGGFRFEIDFTPKKDITIQWIEEMRNSARTNHYGRDLFSDTENVLSPEELIISIAKKFSKVKDCDLNDLLNPKFYFTLKGGLYANNQKDDLGNDKQTDTTKKEEYSGSGGQAYTALALLGIGRLSIVEQDNNKKGVKFIIIEELSNIDDDNFDIFPQIAKQYGYQLITMTPKPFGAYNNEEWFLHILMRGKDRDINTQPMSFFKTNETSQILEDYKNGK